MTVTAPPRRSLLDRLAAIDDGRIMAGAFAVLLAGTVAVLYLDWRELNAADVSQAAVPEIPVLPAFRPGLPDAPAGPQVTTDPQLLRQPLVATLGAGGVLSLTGTIDPGSYERVEAEIAARGEYVKRVELNSPGGAVGDAVKIGQLLLINGFATSVAAGAICASSCPLVFAGGSERIASRGAAIGIHQVYATALASDLPQGLAAVGDAMAGAQETTAVITRYLGTTGVDPAVWVHALETPPDRLYYLSPDELTGYQLATRLTD